MRQYTITDIDGDATHTIAHGTREEVSQIISEGHPIWDLIAKADRDGEATGTYEIDGETFTTAVVTTPQTRYTLNATYLDNGRRCVCDRGYALGQYADTTWDSVEAAEDVADDLRSDVGTVVDASVEYEVVEYSA